MSNSSSHVESKASFFPTLFAVIGFFVIFLIIMQVAYVPNIAPMAGTGLKTPAERKAILVELNGKAQTAATSYAWVDKEKGLVRIPLDRAIELMIKEHATE